MSKARFMVLPFLVVTLILCTGAATYAKDQAYLGVVLQPLTIDLKEAMDVDRNLEGILISEVVDDSPADEYGLEDGDVVIEIDGKEVRTVSGATKTIKAYSPGDNVKIVVLRDGDKKKVIDVKLGKREGKTYDYDYDYKFERKLPDIGRVFKRVGEAWNKQGYLGVRIENISDELGDYFGVGEGEGVLVLEVIDDSPADIAGLQAGDVIVEIDGKKMANTERLVTYIGKQEPGREVNITYKRKRRTRTVEVELGRKDGPAQMFGELIPGAGKCDVKCLTRSSECDKKCVTKSGKHQCSTGEEPGKGKVKIMEMPGGKGMRWIEIGDDLEDIEHLEQLKDMEGLEKVHQLKDMEGNIKVYHMDMDDLHEELETLREEIEELKGEIQKLRE